MLKYIILPNLGIYDLEGLKPKFEDLVLKNKLVRACFKWMIRSEMPPMTLRKKVLEAVELVLKNDKGSSLTLFERQDSNIDQSSKLLFETEDHNFIESVIIRSKREKKTTLCISSQVGCTEKCQFCATATLGFKRNLSTKEILDQVHKSQELIITEERSITHVVFMGMGEPLRNLEAVKSSIGVLLSSYGFHLSPTAITVSTLGLPHQMLSLTKTFPKVQLALSLHAVNDELRSIMMPINEKYSIETLLGVLKEIETYRKGTVMISYLMFKNMNDDIKQAEYLVKLFRERKVIFNLIPFNATELISSDYQACSRDRVQAFKSVIEKAEFKVTIRGSFGGDIDAACGQLASVSVK